MPQLEKHDKWVFTSWKEKPDIALRSTVRYLYCQQEICPQTTARHWQGYVEFYKPYSIAYVKCLFKDKQMYLDKAKCSDEVNYMYCSKQKTRASDSEPIIIGAPLKLSLKEELDDVFNM